MCDKTMAGDTSENVLANARDTSLEIPSTVLIIIPQWLLIRFAPSRTVCSFKLITLIVSLIKLRDVANETGCRVWWLELMELKIKVQSKYSPSHPPNSSQPLAL